MGEFNIHLTYFFEFTSSVSCIINIMNTLDLEDFRSYRRYKRLHFADVQMENACTNVIIDSFLIDGRIR